MDLLNEYGADVSYYDSNVPQIKPSREYSHWAGKESISWNQEIVSSFDAVVISTDHSAIDYQQLAEWSDCIVDSRNALKDIEPDNDIHFWKA
jgi:UDP-N-acetyl-D-glucosamine dehydrogenase